MSSKAGLFHLQPSALGPSGELVKSGMLRPALRQFWEAWAGENVQAENVRCHQRPGDARCWSAECPGSRAVTK